MTTDKPDTGTSAEQPPHVEGSIAKDVYGVDSATIDPLDFEYVDKLRTVQLLDGLVHFGQAADADSHRPMFLFVHGAYHGAWCYSSYLQYLDRAGIPAAALDLPCHGELDSMDKLTTLGVLDYARATVEACRLAPNPVILVGHSLGALVAGVAASQYRIYALGLLAPSPPGQLKNAKSVPLLPEDQPVAPPSERICRRVFLPGVQLPDFGIYHQRLCPESPVAMNDRYDLRINVDKVNLPAICIAAENDSPITHPAGQDEAVADFYQAEYHLLDSAPHCFMLGQDWGRSMKLLHEWYLRISSSG